MKKVALTKREQFAAMAYQALLTAHYATEDSEYSASDYQIAQIAVQQADLLILALNLKPKIKPRKKKKWTKRDRTS